MKIEFLVPGKVQAQQRPRVTRYGTYYPKETVAYKKHIQECATGFLDKPIDKYVTLVLEVFVEVPKSYSKKDRLACLNDEKRPTKSDIDNYCKIVQDALNGIIWEDDRLVTDLIATKRYAEQGYAKITVEWND